MDTNDSFHKMDTNDSFVFVEMSPEAFASVNVPVSVFSIILNIIFVFCMIFPKTGTERPKRHLTVLLGLLVGCNITAHICSLVLVFNNFFILYLEWWFIPPIAIYTMMTSVNSSHWLNVYYCFNIIPVQRPCFIWIKKHLAVFIYSALIVNAAVYLLGMSVNSAITITLFTDGNTTINTDFPKLFQSYDAAQWMTLALFFLSLCVMLPSSCTTAVFLWRHMKNLETNSGSSNSRRQRNIKVTIISISVQAVLHVVCSALVVTHVLIVYVSPWYFDWNDDILCTVISLYCLGTSINMGVSQSLFRQRAVHAWQKCFHLQRSLSVSTVAHTISSDVLSR